MTSPPAEPRAQALGESLAALAVQVAALRGQIAQINQRLDRAGLHDDLNLAARFEDLAQTVADALDAAAPARPRRPVLDRPGPPGLYRPAGRAATVGRYRAAPALRRLRAAGLLAPPHSCRLGTVHPGRRVAPRLRRDTPRPGPGPGVLRPVAARHHAPHHRHHRQVHAALRDAPRPRRLGCSSRVPLISAPCRLARWRSGLTPGHAGQHVALAVPQHRLGHPRPPGLRLGDARAHQLQPGEE